MNIGDKVYQYDNSGKIYESIILHISNDGIFHTTTIDFDYQAIGHTIFTTKEDAQKAFKYGIGGD